MVVTPAVSRSLSNSSNVSLAKWTRALSYTRMSPAWRKLLATDIEMKVQKSCDELEASLMSKKRGSIGSVPMMTDADKELSFKGTGQVTCAGERAYFRTRNFKFSSVFHVLNGGYRTPRIKVYFVHELQAMKIGNGIPLAEVNIPLNVCWSVLVDLLHGRDFE